VAGAATIAAINSCANDRSSCRGANGLGARHGNWRGCVRRLSCRRNCCISDHCGVMRMVGVGAGERWHEPSCAQNHDCRQELRHSRMHRLSIP
jgi:hypothetical protein